MKAVAFTICSINYLAQAITLGKSLQQTNPNVDFRIYLVDRLQGRSDIVAKVPFTLIEIEQVPIDDFDGMCQRYSLVELNTSVKPFIFRHIFLQEQDVAYVVYFDPDIMVFNSLKPLFSRLSEALMVLTPHILTPSDKHPYGQPEMNYLSTGIFNLGFLGVGRHPSTDFFLQWWSERLVDQGQVDHAMHLFYDQKWLNFAPVFFDDVYIEKEPGYNMAGWNLHERILQYNLNEIFVNEKYKLVFFHFSGVKILQRQDISIYTEYTFEQRPDLKKITQQYRKALEDNQTSFFEQFTCYFVLQKANIAPPNEIRSNFFSRVKKLIQRFF